LPFLFGFSTSLVILILNQSLDAVQTFFGKKSSPSSAQATIPRPPPGNTLSPAPSPEPATASVVRPVSPGGER
jgi:hypothetical protein